MELTANELKAMRKRVKKKLASRLKKSEQENSDLLYTRTDNYLIIQGDSTERLKLLKDDSVALWVTSPPYAKQRDYKGAASEDYIPFISPILELAVQKMRPDGSLIINIKEHCDKGVRDLYVYRLIIYLVEELGLRLVDEYMWHKTNPFPTGAKTRLKDAYERIFHFTKDKKYQFFPDQVSTKSTSKWLEGEKRRAHKGRHATKNGSGMNMSRRVVSDIVRPSNVLVGSTSNANNIDHPAVYPEFIPEFFIKLMTKEGDVVGDMFAGSGTSGIKAIELSRKFVGIEDSVKFYHLTCDRVGSAKWGRLIEDQKSVNK